MLFKCKINYTDFIMSLTGEGEFVKDLFTKDLKRDGIINGIFMIMKKLSFEGGNLLAYVGDKTGDIKASIPDFNSSLEVGDVILLKANKDSLLKVIKYSKVEQYDIDDFLPSVSIPIEQIMKDLENITEVEFKSEEAKALNSYFFNDPDFLDAFKKGIGGLSQHHNYRGGLAEHTLNVTYLSKILAYRYDCRYKEVAIISAKLHDIGKIIEYNTDKPFSVSMRGDMEGHIVIGITMLEDAFKNGGSVYSEDFKNRIKGCIVQHHGKLEYGSPKVPNSEESYIVHYADYIDATFNKIGQIKDITQPFTWSEYDRRIGTRLYG